MYNNYQVLKDDDVIIEVWAGGPCIDTGQFCPVWSVKYPNGTGRQTRGLSSGPDIRIHGDQYKKAKTEVIEIAIKQAKEFILKSKEIPKN